MLSFCCSSCREPIEAENECVGKILCARCQRKAVLEVLAALPIYSDADLAIPKRRDLLEEPFFLALVNHDPPWWLSRFLGGLFALVVGSLVIALTILPLRNLQVLANRVDGLHRVQEMQRIPFQERFEAQPANQENAIHDHLPLHVMP